MGKTFEELEKRFKVQEKKNQKVQRLYEELMKQIDELRAEEAILMNDIKEALGEL